MAGCFIRLQAAVLVHQRVTVVSELVIVKEVKGSLAGWGIDAALWVFLEVPLVLVPGHVDSVPSYQLKTEEDKKKEMLHHHRSFLSETLFQRGSQGQCSYRPFEGFGQTEIFWLTTLLHWKSNWTETRNGNSISCPYPTPAAESPMLLYQELLFKYFHSCLQKYLCILTHKTSFDFN